MRSRICLRDSQGGNPHFRVLLSALIVILLLFWMVPALGSQTQDMTVVVLVNANNSTGYNTSAATPGEYQRYPERYFEHLQIPYRVTDVSSSAPGDLSTVQLIVAAHRGLNLSLDWQEAIISAVASGTGFVNLDNDPAIGQDLHIQAFFGATHSSISSKTGFGITVPAVVMQGGATPHYIAALQTRFPSDPAGDLKYLFHYNDTGTRAGAVATLLQGAHGAVLATLDNGDPLILATTYKMGRAVYFATYDYMKPDRFGFLLGVDDLFWRSLVWAARKPFVIRGYPRWFAVQMDDADGNFPQRMADFWNTALTGTVGSDETGGPWKITGNFSLLDFSYDPTDRPLLISGMQAGRFQIGPHANNLDVAGGDFYWNGSVANTDSQWQTKLNQVLAWKAGNGTNGTIPAFSRSMVPHWGDLSNNAGYEMWYSLGQRYITTNQSAGVYYAGPCKTNAQRLMLRPFRLYELPPTDCDPAEVYPVYFADDFTVGSTAGHSPQTFFAFATLPPLSNDWPQRLNGTVAQSVESFERNTWKFWSSFAPYEMYTHDYLNYENASVADRDSVITQFSAWLKARGVRHLFMEQLGDYMYARTKSTLVSAQATPTTITLTFAGKSTDPDGKPVATKALFFYGDNEGVWADIPSFTSGIIVSFPNAMAPAIGLSPTAVQFTATAGGANPAAQTVTVTNTGGGTLNWTATSRAAWLNVSPTAGTNSGTLTLSVDSSHLSAGSYSGSITVAATGASNTPQTVAVTLTIAGPPTLVSITVRPTNAAIDVGSSQQYTATGTYSDGSTQNLSSSAAWTSGNPSVAMINAAGLAVGMSKGTTTIQAASGTIAGSTNLTVTPVLASIAVTPANASIAKGTTLQYTATGTYSDGSTQNLTTSVTWSSSSTAVATITAGGSATAAGAGTTTIQADSGTIRGTTGLTVTPAVLLSIAVTPANPSIAKGATQQFTATGSNSDGTIQNITATVTWTSSNVAVATISAGGLASGVATGTTTIQASLGTIRGSTVLTVSTISGLIGYWTFDEGSGTTAADSSGSGYNATLVNGMSWVAGKLGQAISANGTNQYVSFPAIDLSTTSAATVAMWVNRTYSTAGGHVLLEDTTNFNNSTSGFGVGPDDDTCRGVMVALRGNNGYAANCYAQPTSGVWHHLVAVYDKTQSGSNESSFYIDGVLQRATRNYLTTNNTNTLGKSPLYLFSRAGTSMFCSGMVDDLRIYNRALTAAEVQQIYAAGSQP